MLGAKVSTVTKAKSVGMSHISAVDKRHGPLLAFVTTPTCLWVEGGDRILPSCSKQW